MHLKSDSLFQITKNIDKNIKNISNKFQMSLLLTSHLGIVLFSTFLFLK